MYVCLLCSVGGYLADYFFFFFQAEDGIRDSSVTGVQTCALPISSPVTLPLPLKNPKISSVSVLTGTSFATGSPCLVITTVSRLALTSSMMARQLVLNAPAGMVFMGRNSL